MSKDYSHARPAGMPWRIASFLLWYAKEFFLANLRVTLDVLRPTKRQKMTPAIMAIPAASRRDAEYTMISTLITLTPGTLTLSISIEHRLLYVHGMFAGTREEFVAEIQEMEDRMLGAMRATPGDLSRGVHAPVVQPTDELDDDGDAAPGTAEVVQDTAAECDYPHADRRAGEA